MVKVADFEMGYAMNADYIKTNLTGWWKLVDIGPNHVVNVSLNVSLNDDHQMLKYQSLQTSISYHQTSEVFINMRMWKNKLIAVDISAFDGCHRGSHETHIDHMNRSIWCEIYIFTSNLVNFWPIFKVISLGHYVYHVDATKLYSCLVTIFFLSYSAHASKCDQSFWTRRQLILKTLWLCDLRQGLGHFLIHESPNRFWKYQW